MKKLFSASALLLVLAFSLSGAWRSVWNLQAKAQDVPARFRALAAYNAAHGGVSLLVLDHGKVVFEDYPNGGSPDKPHMLASGTKSFTGLMAAAAVQDKWLNLDEKVSDTISEWREDARKSKITVRQLLSLTSGLEGVPVGKPPAYAQAITVPTEHDPGSFWQYSPAPFQIFGELVKRKLAALHQPADPLAYLDRRILKPIGLHYAYWRRLDGDPVLPSGCYLTAEEWAKLGEFVRHGGEVDGKELVDKEAFSALFEGTRLNPGYGLSWWLIGKSGVIMPGRRANIQNNGGYPADAVMAAGAGNQRLYVIPSLSLTVVRQSAGVGARAGGRFAGGRLGAGRQLGRDSAQTDELTIGDASRFSDSEFLKLLCAQ